MRREEEIDQMFRAMKVAWMKNPEMSFAALFWDVLDVARRLGLDLVPEQDRGDKTLLKAFKRYVGPDLVCSRCGLVWPKKPHQDWAYQYGDRKYWTHRCFGYTSYAPAIEKI